MIQRDLDPRIDAVQLNIRALHPVRLASLFCNSVICIYFVHSKFWCLFIHTSTFWGENGQSRFWFFLN